MDHLEHVECVEHLEYVDHLEHVEHLEHLEHIQLVKLVRLHRTHIIAFLQHISILFEILGRGYNRDEILLVGLLIDCNVGLLIDVTISRLSFLLGYFHENSQVFMSLKTIFLTSRHCSFISRVFRACYARREKWNVAMSGK